MDLGSDSLRLNRGIVENADFAINLVGVSRMPTEAQKIPDTANLSFDIKTKLAFLNTFPSLSIPPLAGAVATTGNIRKQGELYSGKGDVKYEGVAVRGYEVGTGKLAFSLDKRRVDLTQMDCVYAGGSFKSSRMHVDLADGFPVSGELSYQGLRLEEVLKAVRVPEPVVSMETAGQIKVSGSLDPFELKADLDSRFTALQVFDDAAKGRAPGNDLIQFGDGTFKGPLKFTLDKMDFEGEIRGLDGFLKTQGYVGFDDTARVSAVGEKLSLTKMGRIAKLQMAGVGNVTAEVIVGPNDGSVSGAFDIENAEVADLVLGSVRGEAFYQGDLLSFENLELPSLEPVRGNGFVDFKGNDVKYKFYVNTRRTETDQIFRVLKNLKLQFDIPTGGEVASRIVIEGEDKAGVRVSATGQAKNFRWFDEKWLTGGFSLNYKDRLFELNKALLTKTSGALEVKGRFGSDVSRLQLSTFGLEISNFERFGTASITGEVAGSLLFEGPKERLFHYGKGELKLVKTKFRGVPIADSTVRLRPDGDRLEYLFNLGSDRLRGRFVRSPHSKSDELLVYFQDYDFAPLLTLALSRDIPPLSDLKATGEFAIKGNFEEFSSLKGGGSINQLQVGFKGTPMQIHQPAKVKMDETGVHIDSLFLQGEDSQLSLALNYEPDKRMDARLDGRIDLQYLQPFIPGLEYGTGKVSMGLRMSGHPSRYQLLGNVALESGTFRLLGFQDEFRAVEARLSASQDRINVDRFDANVNGGPVRVEGDMRIDRFQTLVPSLKVHADKVTMKIQDYLSGKFSGELAIRGKSRPYLLSGKCDIHEGTLTRFTSGSSSLSEKKDPLFNFDVQCNGSEKLMVATDIMQAEFRGGFHLVGNNVNLGLLGTAESIRGSVLFRDTAFALDSASVKFESPNEILPRFRVAARANLREVKASTTSPQGGGGIQDIQDYEVNLQVSGIPSDYKIRLTSTPALLEGEIISLLVLGVTTRAQDGNFMDLGGALVGQIPLQSKLKNQLGLNIKLSTQSQNSSSGSLSSSTPSADVGTGPTVQIQKSITDKTKLSFSNSLDAADPIREFRIEQMLDDNITVNATTRDRSGNAQAPPQAYGLDFRYRFQFE